MQQIYIEVVSTETPETHLTPAPHLLGSEPGAATAAEGPQVPPSIRPGKSQASLAARCPSPISCRCRSSFGCIDPIDAGCIHGAQDGGGPSDLRHVAHIVSEPRAPKSDERQLHIGRSHRSLIHSRRPLTRWEHRGEKVRPVNASRVHPLLSNP
jgi:hypothetical protein